MWCPGRGGIAQVASVGLCVAAGLGGVVPRALGAGHEQVATCGGASHMPSAVGCSARLPFGPGDTSGGGGREGESFPQVDGEESPTVGTKIEGSTPDAPSHLGRGPANASGDASQGMGGPIRIRGPPLVAGRSFSETSGGLPDGRWYELVTPPSNGNVDVYYPLATGSYLLPSQNGVDTRLPFRAAADGDAVAYVGDPPSVGGSASQGPGVGNEYLAARVPGGGWAQRDIQPPGEERLTSLHYECFSGDLTEGFLSSPRALAEGAPSGPALYARESTSGMYTALAAGGACEGATAGASHVLVSAAGSLYDFTEGALKPVSLLPEEGGSAAGARFGGADLLDAISSDGSRIFWAGGEGTLYMRENDEQTLEIAEGASFWAASADGEKVFFTDEKEGLTSDSTAAPGEPNLYEYDLEAPEGEQTTDLTPYKNADVKGVIGASDDGSYVYFIATGKLANEGSSEPCTLAGNKLVRTGCNLYMYHEGEPLRLVANLSAADLYELPGSGSGVGEFGDMEGPAHRTAEVSPGGSLVFVARESFTEYPAVGEISGIVAAALETTVGPITEVYDYDPHLKRLFCVSCDPDGEPPEPPSVTSIDEAGEQAAYVPVSGNETYQPRFVSADGGEVFFDSVEPLVPQDTNGVQDVYEWERPEPGGCEENEGCVYLLSGGTSSTFSWLLDASESGDDVFMTTRAQLVAEDQNDDYKVYDVSNDGPPQIASRVCGGGACQGAPPVPPIFATPASATFEGVGNFGPQPQEVVKPCTKGYTKKHGVCVKVKKKAKRGRGGRGGVKGLRAVGREGRR
jgi:hypothetical protein